MKTLITFIIFGGLGFFISWFMKRSGIGSGKGYRRISPAEVKQKLDAGEKVFLVDVRMPEEYVEKHIPKSLSIPLDQMERVAAKRLPDKNAPIILYCLTGRRSANAIQILTKLGYQNLYNLGGIMSWTYPTESGRKNGA